MSTRRVMWAAGLRNKPLQERLTAIARSGFTHTSVFPLDMKRWRSEGRTDAQIARAFSDAGVAVLTIDPYTQWTPGFRIEDYPDAASREYVEHDEASVFAMADALGAPQLNLVSWGTERIDPAATAQALDEMALRAKAAGLLLTFEFMPISNLPDLATAMQVLERVEADNVRLTFDTWHFHRSDPNLALLRSIDGSCIAEVQLADGRRDLQGNLMNDLQHHRRLPGQGEFDLKATVAALKAIGAWRSVGPEIFSDDMDAFSAEDAVRHAENSMKNFDAVQC